MPLMKAIVCIVMTKLDATYDTTSFLASKLVSHLLQHADFSVKALQPLSNHNMQANSTTKLKIFHTCCSMLMSWSMLLDHLINHSMQANPTTKLMVFLNHDNNNNKRLHLSAHVLGVCGPRPIPPF